MVKRKGSWPCASPGRVSASKFLGRISVLALVSLFVISTWSILLVLSVCAIAPILTLSNLQISVLRIKYTIVSAYRRKQVKGLLDSRRGRSDYTEAQGQQGGKIRVIIQELSYHFCIVMYRVVWTSYPTLDKQREQSRGSNSSVGKMDQTWSNQGVYWSLHDPIIPTIL